MRIHLIGPGGAGKTTIGRVLAQHLDLRFHDLDHLFTSKVGSISDYIIANGYAAYAARNVATYLEMEDVPSVVACSSGFMVYRNEVHPEYENLKQSICASGNTFVLMPTLDLESCVAETVRRQLGRHYLQTTAEAEEVKIRKRFAVYRSLPCPCFATEDPPEAVATQLAAVVAANNSFVPTRVSDGAFHQRSARAAQFNRWTSNLSIHA